MRPRLIVWGAGELGGRVATAWAQAGDPVLALTRTPARFAALAAHGVSVGLGSATSHLLASDRLLLALPGSAAQSEALAALADSPPPARVVLASSTGYYGTPRGTIDEDTPPGADERARAVGEAEAQLLRWAGERAVVLRLGGLYRPGRGPYSAYAARRAAPEGPPNRPLALIHYDDAATACLAALRHSAPARCYLAVTPPCPTRAEFYAAAALGLPEPTWQPALPWPPADYDVSRLRRDLLPVPAHPDWRDALA